MDAFPPEETLEELKEGPEKDMCEDSDVRFTANVAACPPDLISGSKGPVCSVYIGGFNHLDSSELVRWLQNLDWGLESRVLLVLSHEYESMQVIQIAGELTDWPEKA